MSKPRKRYLVTERTSTRRSVDPASPDFQIWVDFEPGQVVTRWPAHAPVAEWVESGHWVEKKAGEA
jgi:hypothetical protein